MKMAVHRESTRGKYTFCLWNMTGISANSYGGLVEKHTKPLAYLRSQLFFINVSHIMWIMCQVNTGTCGLSSICTVLSSATQNPNHIIQGMPGINALVACRNL